MFPLVLLYWLENVVVGGFNVLRMLCARPRDGVRWAAKAFLVLHQPYHRVVILHLTILGGGFVTLLLKSPLAALVILVALKTAVDLRAHLAERSRFGGEATPAPVA